MKIIQCLIIIIIIVDVIHSFIRIGLGLGSVATFVCVCVRLTALQRQCRALSSTCTLHTFIWWTVGTGFWLVVVFISLCCVRSEWSMIDWYQYHAYAWVGIDWAAEKNLVSLFDPTVDLTSLSADVDSHSKYCIWNSRCLDREIYFRVRCRNAMSMHHPPCLPQFLTTTKTDLPWIIKI